MKQFWISFLCLACLAACNKPQPADPLAEVDFDQPAPTVPAQDQSQEVWVAQVGPEYITRAQLDEILETLDPQDRAFAQTPIGQRNFIQLLVREKLATLDAKEKELDKSEQYLDALVDKRAQLTEIYQNYARQLLLRMWDNHQHEQEALKITDSEIETYFKKYPYEMTIRQIIIADAQTAETILRELKHKKNRWKELERQYSVAPERSRGKELSFMPGEFIPELEVVAANSPVGSVQGFVKTSQGFHIIMKTGERRLSLKDASPRIRTILENQKRDAALDALQNKYKVVIYEQND